MENARYKEILEKINALQEKGKFEDAKIYLFGHCNVTEQIVDVLLERELVVSAILDNNKAKHGMVYRGIVIMSPELADIYGEPNIIVLIATRFYEAMNKQLMELGFCGEIIKVLEYNTYAEYSLAEETLERKKKRVDYGLKIIKKIEQKNPGFFRVFCPFAALGDVYFCMSYLPQFMKKRNIKKSVICVLTCGCANVVKLFGDYAIEVLSQYDFDAAVQATIYTNDTNAFIAHQDRPYVVNLSKALHIKRIPLDIVYRCGVFGLPQDCMPIEPDNWGKYYGEMILPGKTVIIAPYAKSVTLLKKQIWEDIVFYYTERGYLVYTNTVGEEKAIDGTEAICLELSQMKSAVERAGTFIGIRSGLCDVLRTANCRKVALYPDYCYSDTRWKAIDIYHLDEFENILVGEDFKWQKV